MYGYALLTKGYANSVSTTIWRCIWTSVLSFFLLLSVDRKNQIFQKWPKHFNQILKYSAKTSKETPAWLSQVDIIENIVIYPTVTKTLKGHVDFQKNKKNKGKS